MNYKNYFKKNGFIYGVSVKHNFGVWQGYAVKFTDLERAEKWLNTEEYDFRTRMLCSKSAIKDYDVRFADEYDFQNF